jgi:hypothetical protein
MMVQKFVLRSPELVGTPPTVRCFNPDVNFQDLGVKSVSLNVTEGKQPQVVVGINVKSIDVDIKGANVLINAVPLSVEHAVQMYQTLQEGLLKLGVLVAQDETTGDPPVAASGLIVPGA